MNRVTSSTIIAGLANNRWLLAGAIVSAVALMGVRVYADDAADIEGVANNTYVQYDNAYSTGYDANDYPVITDIASAPGTVGGHLYTGWSALAQDQTGSLDIFISQASLTNATHVSNNTGGVLAAGDGVNTAGQYSPFHAEPELGYSSVASSNNYLNITSTTTAANLAAVGAPPVFTVNQLNTVALTTNNSAVVGYYIELQNVTYSGSTGSFQSTFPTYAQANTVDESYTISDNTGSMTMFDYVTSYSTCGALGGTAVPTGPVDVYGFISIFPSSGLPGGGLPELTVTAIAVPEPSTVMLVGAGLLSLLAVRRRRS